MGAEILAVDDEPKYLRILELLLADAGHRLTLAADGRRAVAALEQGRFDLVLTDLQMPGLDGLDVLRRVRELDPDLPVIVVTAYGTVRSAVEAMREGAFDFVEKPFEQGALELQVARALEMRRLRLQNRGLRASLADAAGFHRILGGSPALRAAVDLARNAAASDVTVLLLGESGTGKELFARALHAGSARAGGPFVKLNCAAVPAPLLEAELFGVERGAFTGADRTRPGRFEQAHGGTLFLDEIGDLEPALQPKLLRALEERIVERLGAGRGRPVDVRFVAATNRDLEAAVAAGGFRLDLYHRLAVFPIRLPALRERPEDVAEIAPSLVARFNEAMGRQVAGLSAAALASLRRHDWPGNVRELANQIERAMLLCRGDLIEPAHLALGPGRSPVDAAEAVAAAVPPEGVSLEALERRLLEIAMTRAGGNKVRAAKLLGLTRNTLRYRLEKHGLG